MTAAQLNLGSVITCDVIHTAFVIIQWSISLDVNWRYYSVLSSSSKVTCK